MDSLQLFKSLQLNEHYAVITEKHRGREKMNFTTKKTYSL